MEWQSKHWAVFFQPHAHSRLPAPQWHFVCARLNESEGDGGPVLQWEGFAEVSLSKRWIHWGPERSRKPCPAARSALDTPGTCRQALRRRARLAAHFVLLSDDLPCHHCCCEETLQPKHPPLKPACGDLLLKKCNQLLLKYFSKFLQTEQCWDIQLTNTSNDCSISHGAANKFCKRQNNTLPRFHSCIFSTTLQ